MSDIVGRGITVTEITAMDQPIEVCPETTVAFVGRALRGPLDTPVRVRNFGEFRRRFGDIWGRSSLGPATKQFFDHGGRHLYVVRVANNARGALLCVPAAGSALVLRAVNPGSTERIRAAVDYDRIEDRDDDGTRFNLTLQRINPSTGFIVDQEFFKQLSTDPDSPGYFPSELQNSAIARVEHPIPSVRPDRTSTGAHPPAGYIDVVEPGTDGVELSDYDLVGSRDNRTGMFALDHIEQLDLLYLPPLGIDNDVGPAAVLAAEMYCRERGAMAIIDPARDWSTVDEAVSGVAATGYRSPNLLGYFPRARDLAGDDRTTRVIGAAIAGALCKQDRTFGPWVSPAGAGLPLSRSLRPAIELGGEDVGRLARVGLNGVLKMSTGSPGFTARVTLARGIESHSKFSDLSVRRQTLQIINSIACATRWAVFETGDKLLTKRLRAQVLAYLYCLDDLGAFENDRFLVECDAETGGSLRDDGATILLGFHPRGCTEAVMLSLHQRATGSRVGSMAFCPVVPAAPS